MQITKEAFSLVLEEFTSLAPRFGERRAAKETLRALKRAYPKDYQIARDEVSRCSYERRHYGGGKFYCWVHHPEIEIGDPWPASNFPRDVLAVNLIIESWSLQTDA